ncbi:MAG TPA: hypothetical protein PKA24_19390, partial [Microthrixaceae bacterium]|nr:hypothetical protein [Microthrixaceae bacterium]HMT63034.1 hypothetical protein [Microthrixaceae bacterium]
MLPNLSATTSRNGSEPARPSPDGPVLPPPHIATPTTAGAARLDLLRSNHAAITLIVERQPLSPRRGMPFCDTGSALSVRIGSPGCSET